MSTVALKNSKALNKKTKGSFKDRIADYFDRNRNTFALGMYALSGNTPNVEVLRAMKVL